MWDIVYALGRIAVPIVFIVFGVIQFSGNVVPPTVIAYAVACIDLIPGVLVLVGSNTRRAALALCAFTVLTIFFAHPFWTMEGATRAANQVQALKNISIIGALLMIAAHGAGRFSFDKGA